MATMTVIPVRFRADEKYRKQVSDHYAALGGDEVTKYLEIPCFSWERKKPRDAYTAMSRGTIYQHQVPNGDDDPFYYEGRLGYFTYFQILVSTFFLLPIWRALVAVGGFSIGSLLVLTGDLLYPNNDQERRNSNSSREGSTEGPTKLRQPPQGGNSTALSMKAQDFFWELAHPISRFMLACMGVWNFTVQYPEYVGVEKPPVAQIVTANHIALIDGLLLVMMMRLTGVAKTEVFGTPGAGYLIKQTNWLAVNRSDRESATRVSEAIKHRATAPRGSFSPLLIFPAGTTHSQNTQLAWKLGAFLPGEPVQPICIRYCTSDVDVTFNGDGDGAVGQWRLFGQWWTNVEITLLPVYFPSEEEKKDAHLFAQNVRTEMVRHMEPHCVNVDQSLDDMTVFTAIQHDDFNCECTGNIVLSKLRDQYGPEFNKHLCIELAKYYRLLSCNRPSISLGNWRRGFGCTCFAVGMTKANSREQHKTHLHIDRLYDMLAKDQNKGGVNFGAFVHGMLGLSEKFGSSDGSASRAGMVHRMLQANASSDGSCDGQELARYILEQLQTLPKPPKNVDLSDLTSGRVRDEVSFVANVGIETLRYACMAMDGICSQLATDRKQRPKAIFNLQLVDEIMEIKARPPKPGEEKAKAKNV
eukprot:Clim_evm10s84 gene=Clim_evmTU10s84